MPLESRTLATSGNGMELLISAQGAVAKDQNYEWASVLVRRGPDAINQAEGMKDMRPDARDIRHSASCRLTLETLFVFYLCSDGFDNDQSGAGSER